MTEKFLYIKKKKRARKSKLKSSYCCLFAKQSAVTSMSPMVNVTKKNNVCESSLLQGEPCLFSPVACKLFPHGMPVRE